jgi:hypothetical protein
MFWYIFRRKRTWFYCCGHFESLSFWKCRLFEFVSGRVLLGMDTMEKIVECGRQIGLTKDSC